MDQSILGELPEGFTHLSKFRPADLLDFGRRAKNMAKVLHLPLQDAQKVLARAFGYADLHELHQVLKEPGAAGPYQDQLEAVNADSENLGYKLRFYRDERLMRCLIAVRPEQLSDERADVEVFACDLGLFSSPTAHRAATKSVIDFLASRKGFTQEGFPFGYNGVLHSRYRLWRSDFDVEAFDAFTALANFPFHRNAVQSPIEHLRLLRQFRAPHIFIEMVTRTSPATLHAEPEIELDFDEMEDPEASLLLQRDFDFQIKCHILGAYEAEHQVEVPWDGDEADALSVAIREPTEAHTQACVFTRDIPEFRAELAGWRLSLRLQWANGYADGDVNDYLLDIQGEPTLITAGDGLESMFLLMEKQETHASFQRWRMSGTLLRRAALDAPWMPAGVFLGDYFIPAAEGSYSPPETVLSCFDDMGDSEMYRVWQLLDNFYVARAGYESYGDWVNDGEGSALVHIRYWEPGETSEKASGVRTLELLLDAFQEGYSDSWDSRWKSFGLPDERSSDYGELDESDYDFPAIGVVFLPQPGTGNFGYAIWDGQHDEATTQVLRAGGERQGRASRRYAFMKPERTGPVWDLLEGVKTLPADFVLYDPDEPVRDDD